MSTALQLKRFVNPDAGAQHRPLEPTIGAEISGIDLRQPISDAVRDEIKRTLLEYKVVFFRDQELTPDQHATFAARFGKLYVHPNTKRDEKIANIHKISAADFAKYERVKDPTTVEGGYHTDTSWRLVPTWGAVLRAVHLPEVGGDTIWVDAGAAYEALSEDVKKRLADLHVTHDFRAALQRVGHDYPIVAHPVVKTHRETGKEDPVGQLHSTAAHHRRRSSRGPRDPRSRVAQYQSQSSKFASPGAPARLRSGTTARPCTSRSATMATSRACWIAS